MVNLTWTCRVIGNTLTILRSALSRFLHVCQFGAEFFLIVCGCGGANDEVSPWDWTTFKNGINWHFIALFWTRNGTRNFMWARAFNKYGTKFNKWPVFSTNDIVIIDIERHLLFFKNWFTRHTRSFTFSKTKSLRHSNWMREFFDFYSPCATSSVRQMSEFCDHLPWDYCCWRSCIPLQPTPKVRLRARLQ